MTVFAGLWPFKPGLAWSHFFEVNVFAFVLFKYLAASPLPGVSSAVLVVCVAGRGVRALGVRFSV